jgi:hypothetical protein
LRLFTLFGLLGLFDGDWTHCAVVYNSAFSSYYKDGIERKAAWNRPRRLEDSTKEGEVFHSDEHLPWQLPFFFYFWSFIITRILDTKYITNELSSKKSGYIF